MSATIANMVAPSTPLGGLHPGCEIALRRLSMNELNVAEAIRDGELTSPQRYENVWLFDIRISGTGVAFRSGLKEYAVRDPAFYLTEEFLRRCNGLPVIIEHPPSNKLMLDTEEFRDRIVGTVFVPYVKSDEVWGIAKILDERAAKMMREEQLSTSPAVVFRGGDNNDDIRLKTDKGNTVFFEPDPSLLDHIAIVREGVWDKQGPPTGVDRGPPSDDEAPAGAESGDSTATGDATMAEDDKDDDRQDARTDDDDKKRDDASHTGEKLDRLLKAFDAVHQRLDDDRKSRDDDKKRMDAIEDQMEKFRNDSAARSRDDAKRRDDDDAKRLSSRFGGRKDDDDDDKFRSRRDAEENNLKKELMEEGESEDRADALARGARRMADRRDARKRDDKKRDDDDGDLHITHRDDDKRDDSGRADVGPYPRKARWDNQSCMDAYSKRKDDDDDDTYRKRHDAEEEDLAAKMKSEGEPASIATDKARKGRRDAEERDEKEMRDDRARKDAVAVRKELDELKKKLSPLDLSDADREQFTAVQARTDEVAQHWGQRASRFMPGETLMEYRLRMIKPYQKHSKDWKDVDLAPLPDKALAIAETRIRADAIDAAKNSPDVGPGLLREVRKQDATGRTHVSFFGDFDAAFGMFRTPVRGARVRRASF